MPDNTLIVFSFARLVFININTDIVLDISYVQGSRGSGLTGR